MDDATMNHESIADSLPTPMLEGLGEVEAIEFKRLLSRFMKSYGQKGAEVSDEAWLKDILLSETSTMSVEDATQFASETVQLVAEHDRNLAELNSACARGESKEDWFAQKAQEAAIGMSVQQFGERLAEVESGLQASTQAMQDCVLTRENFVSGSYNLDGFIAEQHHVNTFNEQATLVKSDFVAVRPDAHSENSFDIVIKNKTTGEIVHQYQSKYGADAKATIQLLKSGNYNNQTLLVPAEQVAEVQAAFPGKTVTAHIGGTEKVAIASTELSKASAKELQLGAQEGDYIPQTTWNTYSTKALALQLGKEAAQAGLLSAAIGTGFMLAEKALKGEAVEAEAVVETAFSTGADAGIKVAATGALKAAYENGFLTTALHAVPTAGFATIACIGIENVKVMLKVATGEITMTQAMEQMGKNAVTMTYGLSFGAAAGTLLSIGKGAVLFSWIPVIGPIIGGVLGGMLGYMAGSKLGHAIFEGAKAIGKGVMSGLKFVGDKVASGFRSVKRFIFG